MNYKEQKKIILTIFALLATSNMILADLPIHCIQAQIEGEWELHLTKSKTLTDPRKGACGYDIPISPYHALLNKPSKKFKTNSSMKLSLDRFNVATKLDSHHKTDSGSGKNYKFWTMVYDEAVNIKIGNLDLFTYFQYEKKHGVKISNCDKTLIGFYRNDSTNKHGCFYMTQTKKFNDISADSKGNKVEGATLKLLKKK